MSEAIAGTIAALMLIALFGSVAIIIAWREEFIYCDENVRATYRELRTIYTSDPEKGEDGSCSVTRCGIRLTNLIVIPDVSDLSLQLRGE